MSIQLSGNLVLLGAGKMGGAMLAGWLQAGILPQQIIVLDPTAPAEVEKLIANNRIMLNPSLADIHEVQVLLVAVKPQIMGEVLESVRELRNFNPLVVSIAAGKTIASFTKYFGHEAAVIRTIPNTPASIGRGITVMTANARVSLSQKNLAISLLSSIGEVVEVDNEDLIDAATAVSGSGPAYVFYMTECLAAAAVAVGLPADVAVKLARATVSGSGELMRQSGIDAAELRKNVTSPSGTTFAALQILMRDNGLMPLMQEAVEAAERRSRELAKQ